MITVLGASGQVGSQFRNLVPDAVFLTRDQVDLTEPELAKHFNKVITGPVINCAAWTAVDAAESNEDEATLVNGHAVGVMAEMCDKRSVPFITYSSDYVFNGTKTSPYSEGDPTDPINAYGRSKLYGEKRALAYPGSLVIRTSWVQSGTHPCFVRKMLELAAEHTELRVVHDQTGRPTFAPDLAKATMEALAGKVSGLLHVANEGTATWFDLARQTIEAAGLSTEVLPVTSDEFPTEAARPRYSVLNTSRYSTLGLTPLPPWKEPLREAVAIATYPK